MAGRDDPTHSPSGPILTPAPGFLGFLQLKNSGANPSQLLDQVSPDFDYGDWLLQNNATEYALASAVGNFAGLGFAPFNISPLRTPAREIWYARTITAASACPVATDRINAGVALRDSSSGFLRIRCVIPSFDTPTGVASRIAEARGIWIPPESEFLVYVGGQGAATWSLDVWVNFTRIPI